MISVAALARYQQQQAEDAGAYILTETAATQADRGGRRGEGRAHRRQGPRQGRRAEGQLRARHRHQGQGHRAGRGLLGPPHRPRHPRVRPRRGARAPDLGARREGGLEGPEAARPPDPHDRPVAGQPLGQVRPGRRHLDLPDEGREDRRRPRLDRLRDRPRVRRRHHLRPRPAADLQDPPAGARRSSRAASAWAGAPRRSRAAATGRCPSSRCPAPCWSATRPAWSTPVALKGVHHSDQLGHPRRRGDLRGPEGRAAPTSAHTRTRSRSPRSARSCGRCATPASRSARASSSAARW